MVRCSSPHHARALQADLAGGAGASTLRAGFASDEYPSYTFDNIGAKYRDRKLNRVMTLAGSEAFVDATSRAAIRSPFEGDVVCNFDQMVSLFTRVTLTSVGRGSWATAAAGGRFQERTWPLTAVVPTCRKACSTMSSTSSASIRRPLITRSS